MGYVNAANIMTAIIVLLIIYFLKKLFTADIGENRFFYIFAAVVLGAGLYFWRSGFAAKIIADIRSIEILKNFQS
jgi:hypothetical protein